MKTKNLIILIVLAVSGVGGFYIWENIPKEEGEASPVVKEELKTEEEEEIIPATFQLNVPRVYTGEVILGNPALGPGLCYLGALAMTVLFNDPTLDFTDTVAYSGIGVKAKNILFVGLITNDKMEIEDSIITTAENLGYNFGLGVLSRGMSSRSAKEVNYFSNEEEAFLYLKSIISSGQPPLVHLDLYYVTEDLAKYSQYWADFKKGHYSHFVTVTGYDEEYIYINDPIEPNLTAKNVPIPKSSFLDAWENGARPEIEGARLGPYWVFYLKDKTERKSINEIIVWNKEISKDVPSEIRKAKKYIMIGELVVSRLEFAKFLERNGYKEAASLYREAGNLYLKKPEVNNTSLIADKEEQARNSL